MNFGHHWQAHLQSINLKFQYATKSPRVGLKTAESQPQLVMSFGRSRVGPKNSHLSYVPGDCKWRNTNLLVNWLLDFKGNSWKTPVLLQEPTEIVGHLEGTF
jgi:hypothetical protein